jgi:O-acetyl-ADP-ribose deacetylase (regulator of RNase III)
MPIRYVSGDLFANAHHAEAFAHGCNCQGSMGAGIAVGFRQRYPEMYEEYRALCKSSPRAFNLGDCFLYKSKDRPWVFNLATQEHYWHDRATYESIESSLTAMRKKADKEKVRSIAVPRIGAGKGGRSWRKVKEIIERVFADWSGTLIVYEEYLPEAQGKASGR